MLFLSFINGGDKKLARKAKIIITNNQKQYLLSLSSALVKEAEEDSILFLRLVSNERYNVRYILKLQIQKKGFEEFARKKKLILRAKLLGLSEYNVQTHRSLPISINVLLEEGLLREA